MIFLFSVVQHTIREENSGSRWEMKQKKWNFQMKIILDRTYIYSVGCIVVESEREMIKIDREMNLLNFNLLI